MNKFVATIGVIAVSLIAIGNSQAQTNNNAAQIAKEWAETMAETNSYIKLNKSRRIFCLDKNADNPNAIEFCNISDDEMIAAIDTLATAHHGNSEWAQTHCVPAVPRGYRCAYGNYQWSEH